MNNRKYFVYIRKSTDAEDKQELSLEAQEHEIKSFAQREELKIVRWFSEKRSAKTPGRPVFNEMINLLNEVDISAYGLIAHKPDRLTRNWNDVGQICDVWVARDLDLACVNGRLPNNAQGYAMFGMQSTFSKWYSDNLSEETKKGQRESINQGFFPGVPPLGYLTKKGYLILTQKDTDKREIDPSRAPIVKKAYELYDIGKLSIEGIVQWADKKGFRGRPTKKRPGGKVGKGAWHNILTNPFYYGWFKWLGLLHKGSHAPIVDYELWERVQKRLKLKGHRFQLLYEFPFKVEQMHCGGCGAGITAEQKFQVICSECKLKFWYKNKRRCPKCKTPLNKMNNPKYLHYIYYHCTRSRFNCPEASVRHEYLQQVLEEAIDKITLPAELSDIFREELKQGFKEEQNLRDVSLQNLSRALGKTQEKHDRLLELYIDQRLEKALFDKKNVEYEDEKRKIEIEIEKYKKLDKKWFQTATLYLELSQNAGSLFRKASDSRKNELLNFVFQNLTLKDKKIDFTYKKPFDILVNCQNRSLMLPR